MQKIVYFFKKIKIIKKNSIKNFADNLYTKHYKTTAKLGFNVDSSLKNLIIHIHFKMNSIALIVFDKFIVLNGIKNFTENLLVFNKNITKLKKNEVSIFVLFIHALVILVVFIVLI